MAPNRGAFSKIVTTDTTAESLVVGGATGAATTGTGGIISGAHQLVSAVPAVTTNKLYNDAGTLFWNGSAVTVGGSPAGATGDIQFNNAGAFGADTGVFTYTAATDTLGVNNIISQIGTSLTIKGSTRLTAGTSGDVTIQSGGTGGSGIAAGTVTIKNGDIANLGTVGNGVIVTTGSIPDAVGALGTLITIKPATPTTSDGVGAVAGAGVLFEGGPGQAHNNAPGNGQGGAGGPMVARSGAGGDAIANGNTRIGGNGGTASLLGGAGGSATGSSGTRTGGNGGNVVIGSGAPGTGATANGTAGTITMNVGATTAASISATGNFTHALGLLLTGSISPAQLVANTDNWNPTGLSTAAVIRVDVDAARDITGIVAQSDGRMISLFNLSAHVITLVHDATSTAVNRFFCPSALDFPLSAKASVWIRYDGTSQRWCVFG